LKDFIESEVSDEDRPELLALNDPEPNGPLDMKMVRIHQNNAYRHGLFLICSRMNHSCKPVVEMSSNDGSETEVRAVRDISAGEEITVSYLRTSSLLGKDQRTRQLEHWGFQCTCELCSLSPEEQRKNDKDREKVRRSIEEIRNFFDLLSEDSNMSREEVSPLITSVFLQAQESLFLLESSMKGETEPASMAILLYLAALSELARSRQFLTVLPGNETPEQYLDRARRKAKQLGTMFLSDCSVREVELKAIREAFGGYVMDGEQY